MSRPSFAVLAELSDDIANGRREATEDESRWIAAAFLETRDEQLSDARRATEAEAALKVMLLQQAFASANCCADRLAAELGYADDASGPVAPSPFFLGAGFSGGGSK